MGDSSRVIEENALMAKLSARGLVSKRMQCCASDSRRVRSQPLNLVVRDIRADGHCLYRSLEDQLALEHGALLSSHRMVSVRPWLSDVGWFRRRASQRAGLPGPAQRRGGVHAVAPRRVRPLRRRG